MLSVHRAQLAYLTLLLLTSTIGRSAEPASHGAGAAQAGAAQAGAPRANAPRTSAPRPFTFATVRRLADKRAAAAYRIRSTPLPRALAQLSYAQYRQIRFKPDAALWRGQSRFDIEFYHRGFAFTRQVRVFEVLPSGVRQVRYRPSMFEFGRQVPRMRLPDHLGFAGFSVHYPLNTPAQADPVIAFLGASYFRVLGRNQVYGITARGLAMDTATVGGEQFPYFTDFWLVRPAPHARTMTIYALLESSALTGAYRFVVRPGSITQVTVTATLYPRARVSKLGIAPLTSMFLYGVNSARRRFYNWRPQVHDSDGLMMHTGNGEWLWRPLQNPTRLEVNRFMDDNPRGFGLIQRERDFAAYQDPAARYGRRPSYWIQPLGDWGRGGVELVEIPSTDDINYNIDAYWVPGEPLVPRRPVSFSYVLSSYLHSGERWPPGGRTVATRFGPVMRGTHAVPGMRRVLIDFAGGELAELRASQPVGAQVTAHGAAVSRISVQRLPENGAWRVAFDVRPSGGRTVNLSCYLELYGAALTETWTYQWAT